MCAVQVELLGAEATLAGFFVECRRAVDQLVPVVSRVDVDFDHAGVGGHLDDVNPVVMWGEVALDNHGHLQILGRLFDGMDQFEIVFEVVDRRHEDVQASPPRFDADRGPQDLVGL